MTCSDYHQVKLTKGRNIPVNCGYHLRANCSYCGTLKIWCNVHCMWESASQTCVRNTGILHYTLIGQNKKFGLHLLIVYTLLYTNMCYLAISEGVQLPMHPLPGNRHGRGTPSTGTPSKSEWSEWAFIDYDYSPDNWGDSTIPNFPARSKRQSLP